MNKKTIQSIIGALVTAAVLWCTWVSKKIVILAEDMSAVKTVLKVNHPELAKSYQKADE